MKRKRIIVYKSQSQILSLDWKKNPKPLRGKSGVYRIVEKETGALLYIGQSTNVGQRLTPSAHHVFKKKIHDVYVLFENNKNERRRMEWSFIQLLLPKLNIRNGLQPNNGIEEFLDEQYKMVMPY